MSLFRRRLLIAAAMEQQGGGGIGCIKDGLVLHLDGINKGSDSSAWTDLVGGVKFTYNECIINDNNVEFNGKTSHAVNRDQADNNKIAIEEGKGTIEAVFYHQGGKVDPIFAIDGGIQCVIWKDNSACSYGYSYFLKEIGGYHSISYNYLEGYDNKIKMKKDTASMNARMWASLGKYSSNLLKGKIYSIRIYNRLLSKEEMLHNQQVDIDRFFGGVTPQ